MKNVLFQKHGSPGRFELPYSNDTVPCFIMKLFKTLESRNFYTSVH